MSPARRRRAAHARAAATLAALLSLAVPAVAIASPYSDAQLRRYPSHYLRLGSPVGANLGFPDGWPSGVRRPPATVYDGPFDGATSGVPGALAGDADRALRVEGLTPPVIRRPAVVTDADWPHLAMGRFTWEAWVKPRTLDGTARRIVSSEDEHGGVLLAARRDGIVFARHLVAGSYRVYSYARGVHTETLPETWTTLTHPIAANRWTFVAAQYEMGEFNDPSGYPTRRGVMRLYVDGALVAKATTGVTPEPWTKVETAVGSNRTGWLRFDGDIDEVSEHTSGARVSDAEIRSHYLLGKGS